MKLGVVGYTVRFHTFTPEQVEETYRKISALGYDGLENPLGSKFFTPAEELDLLKKYNLSIAVPAGGDLNDPDKCMRLCEEYDVNILGISSIPGEMMNSVDGFKAYALQMNKWAAPFKGTGIRLKYHNHSQEFRNFPELGGKSGMEIFFEETDPELVCFELDTHWMAGAGADPAAWIRKAKGRIPLVHYKDFAINWKAEDVGLGSITKRYAEVGQGNINWENVAQATREAGCEWIFVEQDRTPGCAFESLKTSIDFINKLGVRF